MITKSIETGRLTIRLFEEADSDALYTYMTDPDVMEYVPGGALSADRISDFISKNQRGDRQAYALILKESGLLVGHVVIHPWFVARTLEIGWVIHPAYRCCGYATEAAESLIAYGFEHLDAHRIIATCQPENVASKRVMEKAGLREEGLFRQAIPVDENTWWDEYFFALLATEWFSVR